MNHSLHWIRGAAILAAICFLGLTTPTLTAQGAQSRVYTTTNDAGNNEVLVFAVGRHGDLSYRAAYATGGVGTGGGLGNQGAVVLSDNGRWLFAVNAGSDSLSVFRVSPRGLHLRDTVPSGGSQPVSVTSHGRLVYVVNESSAQGGVDSINGFRLSRHGHLHAIPQAQQPLSAVAADPAQIGFSPDGRVLVVTEKATNTLSTYRVDRRGRAGAAQSFPSEGPTPFGFAFRRDGTLFVSEAAGGAPNASTVSSYHVDRRGGLSVLESRFATMQTAACWVAADRSGRRLYTANTPDASLTGLSADRSGALSLLDPSGISGEAGMGSAPRDLGLTRNGRFLYTLNGGTGAVGAFRVERSGALTSLGEFGSLPGSATGLAVR